MSDELEYLGCSHEAARLLPWFVAGVLAPEDNARVQEHLHECALCAADERREQRIQALVGEEPAMEPAQQPGLQKLLARIDEYEQTLSESEEQPATVSEPAPLAVPQRPGYVRWLAAAVVIQAVGLGVLATLLWERTGEQLRVPRFTTLSTPMPEAGAGPHLRVVFAPSMTVDELRRLLESVSAMVAAGPSASGVYTLGFTDPKSSAQPALEKLRADPRVLFAEPL